LKSFITFLSVTRLALPYAVLLADELALGLGLALAEAEPVAVALPDTLGEGLGVAAGTILAEVFAVLVALALGLALADPPALADGLALPDGLAEGLALGEGVVVLVAPYGSNSSTWRNMSRAVELTSWIVCDEPLPGTVTTSRLGPCGWTCAPELPVPLTRDWMTEMAAFISSADGAFPFCV